MVRISALIAAAALVAACKDSPSALEPSKSKKAKSSKAEPSATGADPWSNPGKKSGDDDDQKSNGGGFDLQGTLSKIKDSIQKPGPYEAPESSPKFDASQPHWGVMKLRGAIVEREAFSFTGGHGTELRELVDRLRDIAKDDKLVGVVVRLEPLEISLPDAVELRAVMHEVRAAGKKLFCHSESLQNATYLIATACDKIALAPLGEVVISGPAAMPVHLKGLLDKLGVQADFVHIGKYKGAAEPLTRDAPSDEMMTVLNEILDRRYQTFVDIVAKDRGLEPGAVKGMIDTAMFTAPDAKAARLVDETQTFEAFRDGAGAAWTRLDLDADKANALEAALKIARFVGAMPAERPVGDHVAVVYAVGNIIDGRGDGVLGARGEIASHTLVPALHALAIDDSVKAVVLRVDSGGGSAQASELIWAAIRDLKAKKPVIVSMSDVAASGGYYISSGATKIYALDDTLTGSIGVVGGKIAPRDALAKVGVTTFPIGKGKRATMWSSLGPWSEDERHAIETTMGSVYDVFKGRVAAGRHKTPDDVEKLAQGRVWTGAQAKENGLVDEIGGLDAALAEARSLGKVDAAAALEIYPNSPTLRDVLHSFGQVQAPLGLSSELDLLDPQLAHAAHQLVDLVLSFRTASIQTVAILPVLQ